MPASLVTVIITTSPTPSAPSTELVEAVLASYRAHCPGLLRCRAIVVLDAYDAVVTHARLKRGRVTADEALCYEAYKANVKRLVAAAFLGDPPAAAVVVAGSGEAEYGSPRQTQNTVPFEHVTTTTTAASGAATVTFVEPAQRLGFALAVRSALRLTTTPYVWVQQHDWVLAADIPLAPLLDVMMTSGAGGDDRPPVKYVCFPSVRMLRYAVSAHVLPYSALRALTTELRRDFAATSAALPPPPPPAESEPAAAAAADAAAATVAVPLTPLFFWHDKIHLASTAHYLERVFSSRLAVSRGDFIEDTVGHRAREQMKAGRWRRWACWLYYPCDGALLCQRHLQGRTWRGAEAETRRKEAHRAATQVKRKLWKRGVVVVAREKPAEPEQEGGLTADGSLLA